MLIHLCQFIRVGSIPILEKEAADLSKEKIDEWESSSLCDELETIEAEVEELDKRVDEEIDHLTKALAAVVPWK